MLGRLLQPGDARQAELVRRYPQHAEHSVTVVTEGRVAIDHVRGGAPDLLILDVMMPGLDGLDVRRTLRRDHEVPVLVVTARSTAEDELAGFDLGADDYLTKPYGPRELRPRGRALLRRSEQSEGSGTRPTTRASRLLPTEALASA